MRSISSGTAVHSFRWIGRLGRGDSVGRFFHDVGSLHGILVLFLVLASFFPTEVGAQAAGADVDEPTAGADAASAPTARAVRIEVPVEVDGVLDDEAWRGATAHTGFVQRTPNDGAPASHPTGVRVVYDEEALYVGISAYDPEPEGIVQGESIRDNTLDDSDAVLLIFDTFHDLQNGFVFGTNPAGIEYDGQVVNEGSGGGRFSGGPGQNRQQAGSGGGFNLNWDASWQVATSRDDDGWYAEFRIPFSTLRYGSGIDQTWGFNVVRRVRRLNEESFWSPVSREFNLYRVSEAGTLTGLEPPARRTVQVTPYVLGSTSRDYAGGQPGFDESGEVGGDAKIQVTQGLTMDLTYNTDFAQVEVDDVQTNLTRFRLFFPEKRPFFLENAGFFSVGTGEAELFFSRRIGIAPGGQQVPIEGGGRLSGRVVGLNLGLLHIRTEGVPGVAGDEGDAFSVARLAKELPNRSSVGGIFVERDALGTDTDFNRTYGLDGQLGIGEALTFSSFLARTETGGAPTDPGGVVRDNAFQLDAAWQSRAWQANAEYREIGNDFDPEVGFLPRDGYRYYRVFAMHFIFPEDFLGLREIRPHAQYRTYRDLDTGFEETGYIHLDTHFEWHGGTLFSPVFDWNREGLEQPFEIAEGVVVPPGTYDGWEAAWRFNTNPSATLSFGGGFNWGSFLSGPRRGTSGTVTYRSGSSLSTSLRFDYNDVELAEGDFVTRLWGLRVGYFFTPRIYLQSLLQYSDQIDAFSANVRFGWLQDAGTGLFVVFNDARGVDALDGPLNRSVVVKYSRQLTLWGR
ncbi:MAG: DUF5916 domain-containing protein [Longimicrobiales bacterium]|nr:DUF5916 domain-containing protein [Longimicrobiales bacterium]